RPAVAHVKALDGHVRAGGDVEDAASVAGVQDGDAVALVEFHVPAALQGHLAHQMSGDVDRAATDGGIPVVVGRVVGVDARTTAGDTDGGAVWRGVQRSLEAAVDHAVHLGKT